MNNPAKSERLFGQKETWIKNLRNRMRLFSREWGMLETVGDWSAALLEKKGYFFADSDDNRCIRCTLQPDGALILTEEPDDEHGK